MIQVLEVSKPAQPLVMNKQQSKGTVREHCKEHCKGRYPDITYIRVRSEQHNIIRILNKAVKLLNTDVTTEEWNLTNKTFFIFVNKKDCHIFSMTEKHYMEITESSVVVLGFFGFFFWEEYSAPF